MQDETTTVATAHERLGDAVRYRFARRSDGKIVDTSAVLERIDERGRATLLVNMPGGTNNERHERVHPAVTGKEDGAWCESGTEFEEEAPPAGEGDLEDAELEELELEVGDDLVDDTLEEEDGPE